MTNSFDTGITTEWTKSIPLSHVPLSYPINPVGPLKNSEQELWCWVIQCESCQKTGWLPLTEEELQLGGDNLLAEIVCRQGKERHNLSISHRERESILCKKYDLWYLMYKVLGESPFLRLVVQRQNYGYSTTAGPQGWVSATGALSSSTITTANTTAAQTNLTNASSPTWYTKV